jgi:DNA-binding transcriptional MerR regulator
MQRNESERAEQEARAKEAAYRRGYSHAADETARLVLQLVELGYKVREIKRLLAVYDDHFLAAWRDAGDLDTREAAPPFDVTQCQIILAGTTGYDWIV